MCSATFIAIAFIDRLGRRPLLIAGLIGMGLSLAAVGFAFQQSGKRGRTQCRSASSRSVALIVFIVSFAFSLGPVTWTVINEIYPGDIRGRAVAVATAVNWGAAFLVSEFFLSIVKCDRPGLYVLAVRRVLRSSGWSGSYVGVPETRCSLAGGDRRRRGAPRRPAASANTVAGRFKIPHGRRRWPYLGEDR